MRTRAELGWVAFASLLFTYAFFFEYLPPFKVVHIPYDLDSYHYPLLDYGFRLLRQGGIPQWDASIYCGISLVGNPQVGLFYPPTWLLYLVNAGHQRLLFWTVEVLVILHVWLGFLLCYLWLRYRGMAKLASAFGAGVFAFSGYLLLQLQHYGLACAYAWMPLGLWGIDEAARSGHWRPLWKLVVASALCFLPGYPPTWFVFWAAMGAYALGSRNRVRTTLGTAGALALSALIVTVQVLPAWEASSMKTHELKYGNGIRDPEFYVAYFVPNYFDFAMDATAVKYGEYLYLGAPAFLGLAYWALRRRFRETIPALVMLGVVLIAVTNPFDAVWRIVKHSSLLSEICRDWYFLAGITLAITPIAASGLDAFLSRKSKTPPSWAMPVIIGALVAWSVRLVAIWWRGGPEFAGGWAGVVEPAVFLALFTSGLFVLRGESGRRRVLLSVTLLLAAGVDYKAFGTSKRFNARPGKYDRSAFSSPLVGLDDAVYAELRAHPEFRIVLDTSGPFPTLMRHYGLRTPQGFDPMLPAQYSEKLKEFVRPSDSRMFDFDPERDALLRSLGVRYVLTSVNGGMFKALAASAKYRLLEPSTSYFKAFELLGAQPSYYWEPRAGSSAAVAERTVWKPGVREFKVRSPEGGRFVLAEQFFPGWRATVDGFPVSIDRYDGAFQSIGAPPGEHTVRFRFQSPGLLPGALLSLAGIVCLWVGARLRKPTVL